MKNKISKLILIVMFLSAYIWLSFNQENMNIILETNRIFVDSIRDYYDSIEKQKRLLQEINAQLIIGG